MNDEEQEILNGFMEKAKTIGAELGRALREKHRHQIRCLVLGELLGQMRDADAESISPEVIEQHCSIARRYAMVLYPDDPPAAAEPAP